CALRVSADYLQLASLLFQNVALTPLGDVDSEHFVVNQTAAKFNRLVRMRQLNFEALQQLVPDFARDVICVGRIGEVIEQTLREQHLPVCANQVQQPLPVKPAARAVDYVANVGAVKALPPGDKNLGGNQIFRRQHPR